jgi:hypothetical protein
LGTDDFVVAVSITGSSEAPITTGGVAGSMLVVSVVVSAGGVGAGGGVGTFVS